jgi:NAD-dependent deacetylase
VVWFGETLPEAVLTDAWEASTHADVFLSIGTSAVVYPAAELPIVAKRAGAYVAEINVEHSAIAHGLDAVLLGPAGEVLPELVDQMVALRQRSPRRNADQY